MLCLIKLNLPLTFDVEEDVFRIFFFTEDQFVLDVMHV
jgi:hypothetical protein